MINERHAKILEARGFEIELLEALGIASNSRLGSDCIAIPIVRDGVKINSKYRTIAGERRYVQNTGQRPCFWNADRISDPTLVDCPLIITEGEFDAIAAIQAGFGRVVSVPNGAPELQRDEDDEDTRTELYRYIKTAPAELAECKEIILAVDRDAAGIALLNDLALRLGRARCKWVKYPGTCKDLADVLQHFGQRGVAEAINRAQWMEIDGLYRMSELPPLPKIVPLDSGFPGLQPHYRLRPGDLTVVTGIPGHGKTTVILDIVCRMVMRHSWRACLASFEMTPQRELRRFLRTWHGARLVVEMSPQALSNADHWIDQNFLFVAPGEDDDVTLEWLMERLSSAVVRHGVKLQVGRSVERNRARPAAAHDADRIHRLCAAGAQALRSEAPGSPDHRRPPQDAAARSGWEISVPIALRHQRQRPLVQPAGGRHHRLAWQGPAHHRAGRQVALPR